MWSDNETDVDLLRYAYLASSVSRIVRSERLLPTTVGVFGDWGSGKSSLLKMVRADLEADSDVMCLTFDGWLFEGYEDAKTALMGTILDAIEDRIGGNATLWKKVKERFEALRQRVNWLRLAAMTGRVAVPVVVTGSPDPSGVAADVAAGAKTISPADAQGLLNAIPEGEENLRRNIRDFRKDFGKLLKEAEIGTLVVFIDDLDRCMPDTIIETLEAIKLFLFAPGTAFVLGADERLVEYAVRLRFPELPNTELEVGRNYLEKLVQFPIRIPALNGADVQSYANLLFAELDLESGDYGKVRDSLAESGADGVSELSELSFDLQAARNLLEETAIPTQLEKDLDLVAQVTPVLTPGLGGNPRRVKRFLNTLLLRMAMGEDRNLNLQRQVLAKLMLLEYVKPEFFKKLAELQANQGGRPSELVSAETRLRRSVFSEDGDAREADGRKTTEKRSASGSKGSRARTEGEPPRPSDQELPSDVQPWMADDWTRGWLASEPVLKDVDLRPYFYVAHDKVGALDGSQLRLTPAVAEVLNRLLSDQETTRGLGLSRSENLNGPEATALFQGLAERVRRAESLGPGSPQVVLFKLMGHRPELLPQLVTLYDSLPETKITLETPGLLYEATKGLTSAVAARGLLERWGRSEAKPGLAGAAQTILVRAEESG